MQQVLSPVAAYGQDMRDDRNFFGLRSLPGTPMDDGGASAAVGVNPSRFQSQMVPVPGGPVASPRAASRRPVECDYDANPTALYLAVQRKDWDGAVERSATHPHEAGTWVSRRESDGRLRWRLLPLHAAVIFRAPERTISSLLFAYVQGAACKDDQGSECAGHASRSAREVRCWPSELTCCSSLTKCCRSTWPSEAAATR